MRIKHLPRLAVLLACLAMSAAAPRAAGPRDTLMVTSSWLAQHLHDPNLVVLTLGEEKTYAAEHIPGARFITMGDVSEPMDRSNPSSTALSLEMPTAERMHDQLQQFGISDDSKIVVYYSDGYFSPSTRVVFALNYAGLGSQTVLLEGGLRAWKAAGNPTTAEVPPVKAGRLSPLKLHTELIVDAAFVQTTARTAGYALVDGRETSSYVGTPPANPRPNPPPLGHIPGAMTVSFEDTFNEREELRSPEELERLFTNAGVKPGDTVVGYCWVGQRATAMLFAARTLGHPVKLYDGSINDWTKRNLPLEVVKK